MKPKLIYKYWCDYADGVYVHVKDYWYWSKVYPNLELRGFVLIGRKTNQTVSTYKPMLPLAPTPSYDDLGPS